MLAVWDVVLFCSSQENRLDLPHASVLIEQRIIIIKY